MDANAPQVAADAPSYRLDLKYFGAPFHGWQSQPSGTCVQDFVEKALSTMLRHPVRVIAAARTDSGVHAEHQVAIFKTNVPFDERRWVKSLYGMLPDTIGITRIAPCPSDFHPILAATGKAYCYRIWRKAERNPFLVPYVWTLLRDLDVKAMREGAAHLVGRHDFTSFCAIDSSAKTRIRNVLGIEIIEKGHLLEIWVTGEGFLKQMIRNIAGTLADVGTGRTAAQAIPGILAAKNRDAAGATAPAQGLTLVEIYFGPIPAVSEVVRRERDQGLCFRVE